MADPNYQSIGSFFKDDLSKESDPWQTRDDDLRPLFKCTRCGAFVNGGGLSRERHDGFHAALADLFEQVEKLTNWASGPPSNFKP
jgi:hypothetical protein